MTKPVYIVDGVRTPQLKAMGKPGPFAASDMATTAARALLTRVGLAATEIDELILGCVMPSEREANIARVTALRTGIPQTVPAWTVQRNCASGMQSIDCAMHSIQRGDAELVMCGGVEAMSRAPLLYNQHMVLWLSGLMRARSPMQKLSAISRFKLRNLKPVIALLFGLTDDVVGLNMGETAENIAARFDVSRDDMDALAVASHQRLIQAQNNNWLDEIEVLYDDKGNYFDHDDGVRADSSVDRLARLRPAFDRKYGKVTAGNSAQITDGACMVLLASEEAVAKHDLNVIASIRDSQWAGLDPRVMGMGPVHAMTPIMQRQQLGIDDVDYWEINEAFATQVIGNVRAWDEPEYCRQHLGLDQVMGMIPDDKLNVDGGGISLGHPVGASGARIVLHLANILKRENAKCGIASLCIGGGQGGAMLIDNVAA